MTALTSLLLLAPLASATDPYFEDFEAGIGSEWSQATLDSTHPDPFTTFTGRFVNETQTLTWPLAEGDYCLDLDAYIIDSWESSPDFGGDDTFRVTIGGTSAFDHTMNRQCGEGEFATYLPPEGTCDYGEWGFERWSDGIFQLAFDFDHPGGETTIQFEGAGLQGLDDESWGVDNVRIRNGPCEGQ